MLNLFLSTDNQSLRRRSQRCFILISMALCFLSACYLPTPKDTGASDWYPQSKAEIQVRKLPPARSLYYEYATWLESATEPRAHLYEATIIRPGMLYDRKTSIRRGDSPLGGYTYTSVEMKYCNPLNGDYLLKWEMRGRHKPEFLFAGDFPRIFLLQPLWPYKATVPPRLEIVGVKGVKQFTSVEERTGEWAHGLPVPFGLEGLKDAAFKAKREQGEK